MKQDKFWPSFEYFAQNANKNWTDKVLIQAIAALSTEIRYAKMSPDDIYKFLNIRTAEIDGFTGEYNV